LLKLTILKTQDFFIHVNDINIFLSSLKGIQFDKNTSVSETQLMGYEQGELLSCIDNGQLPAMLAEQLEVNHSYLFYDGCIIAEIRDYRKVYPHNKPEIHHVLLKPSTQVHAYLLLIL
jgi:hypothetical protein